MSIYVGPEPNNKYNYGGGLSQEWFDWDAKRKQAAYEEKVRAHERAEEEKEWELELERSKKQRDFIEKHSSTPEERRMAQEACGYIVDDNYLDDDYLNEDDNLYKSYEDELQDQKTGRKSFAGYEFNNGILVPRHSGDPNYIAYAKKFNKKLTKSMVDRICRNLRRDSGLYTEEELDEYL